MVEARDLSPDEGALLAQLLRDACFPGGEQLAAQVREARVVGGLPTFLDLEVPRTVPPAPVGDGPAPLRAFVEAPDGEVEGELLVWVKGGYLAGLEFAWYSADAPSAMPPLDRVRID